MQLIIKYKPWKVINPLTIQKTLTLLAYKKFEQFPFPELVNKQNSIRLLFEINRALNKQTENQTSHLKPRNLLEDNEVEFTIPKQEPLLFQQFREFYYKQDFFAKGNTMHLWTLESRLFVLKHGNVMDIILELLIIGERTREYKMIIHCYTILYHFWSDNESWKFRLLNILY